MAEASSNRTAFTAFLLHLHPRTVPAETLRFRLSFGLGGMSATLCCLLIISGILQLLSYSPHVESAYQSVQLMYNDRALAGFIRNIHFWSANLLVIIAVLHLLRVYLTGALQSGRRLNWLIGIALILLVLLANFTGYLLPWDQLAYWAVTIFTSMTTYIPLVGQQLAELLRGGKEVGPATLSAFFAIHVSILPCMLVLLLCYHFWLIRRAGGLVVQHNQTPAAMKRLPAAPHLIVREMAAGLSLIALVVLISALLDAPLADPANPGESPNPAKAAWYFMGLQELLLHLHPVAATCILPLLLLAGLAALPFPDQSALPPGQWFGGAKGGKLALLASIGGFLITVLAVLIDAFFIQDAGNGYAPWIIRGLIPLVTIGLCLSFLYLLLRKQGYTQAQSLMAVMLSTLAGVCALTAIGIWFRGPGMQLALPVFQGMG